MYTSTIKKDLKRRYAIKHFLSITEQAKEAVWTGTTFLLFTLTISYFGAHWLLWLTGYFPN